jgi:DNA invertase Pin-like site-specific DNA recombinase
MKFGYARVSTDEQDLDLQLHVLDRRPGSAVFQGDDYVETIGALRP